MLVCKHGKGCPFYPGFGTHPVSSNKWSWWGRNPTRNPPNPCDFEGPGSLILTDIQLSCGVISSSLNRIICLFSNYVVLIRIVFRAMGWYGSFLPPAPLSGINPACCAFPTSTKTLILANMFFHCIVHWNTELLTLLRWQHGRTIKSRYEQKNISIISLV